MSTPAQLRDKEIEEAVRLLSACDPKLAQVIRRVGPCSLKPPRTFSIFSALLQSIVYQQLAGKAAAAILGRVHAALGPGGIPTPEGVIGLPDSVLRQAGLSRSKLAAIRDLAEKTLAGQVPTLPQLRRMSDEEIIEKLIPIRGVGRWTVEMLLIFRLGRPDVLPIMDYGVRKGFGRVFQRGKLPTSAQLVRRGERWRPYRSVASWYLWRALDLPSVT
jgi:3-methyladenine DNA glycosylase/8-oxoguanine DNA glycosylase